jgi:hypothetical protein
MDVPVTDNLKECVRLNKAASDEHKGSMTLLGTKSGIDILMLIPFGWARYILKEYSKKLSVCFTGAPGPKEGWLWDGVQALGTGAVIPSVSGEKMTAISTISLNNTMQSNMISDKHDVEDPDEFMNIYDRKLREFVDMGRHYVIPPKIPAK